MDELADQALGVVYPGDELGYDLQPRVNVYGADTVAQGLVHFRQVTVVEPQGQQSEKRGWKRVRIV